ncbi:hypothetical protein M5V91_24275 [Cytobacillus pseudoceanisediminis]|uniref:hypothetical protein n=1 Tax=Cytobacillus pseudoceanisediminis TaxID=3051614 RepID=UPI002188A387|nr:hypothetical protein [Cytobacillus pseudoceanisediminis]UQX53778.1 hypothetical protein M5V91_24275 [Cytobacillus pseudoceanisediminis]
MSQFKRVICLFLVLLLAVQPITVLGVEKENTAKASRLKETIHKEGLPKRLKRPQKILGL